MSAPKLRPGTPMEVRSSDAGQEARTPRSHWHRVKQWWLRHHLTREDSGEWRDESGWGGRRHRVTRRSKRSTGLTREQLREEVRLGQHAQQLREEAVTKGGREERARFYGTGEFSGRGAGADEQKITVSKAERDRARYEAEQAELHGGRRRNGAEFRLPWEV